MTQYIDMTGKTEEEAIEKALAQLAMDRDEVSVEVLERAKPGFLGIGATPAKVRVSYDDGKPESEKKPVFQPEQRKSKEEREREAAEKKAEQERRAAEVKNAPKPELPKEFTPEVIQSKGGKPQAERARHERKPREERPAREPRPAPAELGEEVHDERSEQIRAFLSGLLRHLESEAEVRVYVVEKSRYKVILEGDKLGALIGRRGETLDAIQQLTGYAVNRGGDKERTRVQIDAEGYREKREQSLERLAEKMAAKVVRSRRNMTLEPMNAYERHVIHTALQDRKDVSTFSIGTEPNRRVVVAYDRGKQTQKGED